MTRYLAFIAALALTATATISTVEAKKLTVTQRHDILSNRINSAQKAGNLTLKEANDLREDLADVCERQNRMKADNGGKLSYADITKIEKDLNGISNKIHKKHLSKRVD
ncbi:MAG: hypothetical protein K2W82_09565 [Candidatus Obscuribacterales bacterium]|nr:hypothetical protein [Candidatus Obscuribacterales bacterium]